MVDVASTVLAACKKFGDDRGRLKDILREIQQKLGCINDGAMELVAATVKSSRVEVEGVVTFYSFFSREKKGRIIIRLCDDIIDRNAGIEAVAAAFAAELGIKVGQTSPDGRFSLEYTPCIGMSDQAPAALVNEVVITNLTAESARDAARFLKKEMNPSKLVAKTGDGNNGNRLVNAMVKNNIRKKGDVLLGDDVPADAGLKNALKMSPQDVIKEIADAGLKGRGGAGFPTGDKFRLASKTEADRRYVICNADEGEPGTFKDRVLLTERAELVFEGMTIAGYAIGSDSGIMYLRAEYEYLRPFLEDALENRRKKGLLGRNILGAKGFDFDVRIQMGAGAYICGEESALISSCEGLRGEPKNRPPFPVEKGYLGKPTTVNNVETLCCVARILDRGAPWFYAMGTKASKGTKLLSVCGDCQRPGIYEVPYGVAISELLDMAGASDAAIVQVGGAGGTMVGRAAFGRKICFSDLATGGAIMVFGHSRNPLALVDYFLEFFAHESCGYCTPCRVGVVFLRERMQKIMRGFAERSDLGYLGELSQTIKATSRCGLGSSAVNCVVDSMREFPLVYASHLTENKDGFQSGFDIQKALDESRRLARRSSMIYDPVYGEEAEGE
jgi:[NiFe] hydrogenase diaphorase moiety large subunit